RLMVELLHAVGHDVGVVVGQRYHPGAESDVPRPLSGGGDEELGRGDDLVTRGMVLAHPGLVVAEAVEVLDELEVTLDGERRILVHGMEGREEDAGAETIDHEAPFFQGSSVPCWKS